MDFYSEEEIIVTNGASEALDTSLRSIIEPGDEILIPGPIYAGYIPLVETLGGKPIYIDTTHSDFKVTPELIETYFTNQTKAILLNYPTNPTGVILERSEVEALVHYLKLKKYLLSVMKYTLKIRLQEHILLSQNMKRYVTNYYSLAA